jgi:diadenosine tetraphosphate (Ap4A) HIT family hydrolase
VHSPGVVPRRHIGSWFDLTHEERLQILELLDEARHGPAGDPSNEAFNIGINAGPAAGQTVPHVHVPRGGIRWILPEKAPYWRRDSG